MDLYRRHARCWVNDRGTQPIEARWLDRFCNLQPEHASVLDIWEKRSAPSPENLRIMQASIPPNIEKLIDKNGFDVVAHQAEDSDSGGLTIWLAQLR